MLHALFPAEHAVIAHEEVKSYRDILSNDIDIHFCATISFRSSIYQRINLLLATCFTIYTTIYIVFCDAY